MLCIFISTCFLSIALFIIYSFIKLSYILENNVNTSIFIIPHTFSLVNYNILIIKCLYIFLSFHENPRYFHVITSLFYSLGINNYKILYLGKVLPN